MPKQTKVSLALILPVLGLMATLMVLSWRNSQAAEGKFSGAEARIDELSTRTTVSEVRIDSIYTTLGEIKTEQKEMRADVSAKLDKLLERGQ